MENLKYTDQDGYTREIRGELRLTTDKAGRMWLWSEKLQHNVAYKYKDKEMLLLAAINSLMHTIELQESQIKALSYIKDQVDLFINSIRPDREEE